ncbi:MAG: micrococcal nuclease [Myxococcota bacterium]|jgi:micrococcal nuclease
MLVILAALLACGPKKNNNTGNASASRAGSSTVTLDGEEIRVRWDDGDTFRWTDGGEEKSARLLGFNTLESYGPVHRWGGWSGSALMKIADEATAVASEGSWECTTAEGGGGYGRGLIDCPQLRRRLLRLGLAHAYTINGTSDAGDLGVQANAISSQAGMWASGAPEGIVTSLHSDQEDPEKQAYDRVCSVTTGRCAKVSHRESYRTCEEVGHQGSFMLYVPYEHRYGDSKPDCIR